MVFSRAALLLCAIVCAGSVSTAQNHDSQSSQSESPGQKPAPPRRLTEAAKAAEAEGEQFLFQKHDTKSAIESFKKCIQLDGWYGHGYIMLGVAYIQAQRWDDAQWAFQEASKLEPENLQAWLGIASAMNEQKNYTQAQKTLQHCLDMNPDSAEAHYEMGRTLLGLGKLPDAELEGQRSIQLNKDYVSPHVLMANIALAQYDADTAIAEFREALRLDPDGPEAQDIKDNISTLEKAESPQPTHKKR